MPAPVHSASHSLGPAAAVSNQIIELEIETLKHYVVYIKNKKNALQVQTRKLRRGGAAQDAVSLNDVEDRKS